MVGKVASGPKRFRSRDRETGRLTDAGGDTTDVPPRSVIYVVVWCWYIASEYQHLVRRRLGVANAGPPHQVVVPGRRGVHQVRHLDAARRVDVVNGVDVLPGERGNVERVERPQRVAEARLEVCSEIGVAGGRGGERRGDDVEVGALTGEFGLEPRGDDRRQTTAKLWPVTTRTGLPFAGAER